MSSIKREQNKLNDFLERKRRANKKKRNETIKTFHQKLKLIKVN